MSGQERAVIHDPGTEMAVVGAMMYRPDCRDEVFDQLTASDFHLADVRETFTACKALFDRGLVSDVATVNAEVSGRVSMERLVEFERECPSSRNIGSYVAKVQEFATRRALREYALWTNGFSQKGQGSAGELLEKAREEFEALQSSQAVSDVFPELETMAEFLDRHEDVDEYSPWLMPGLIREAGKVLLVGPEGAGKTTVLRQLAILAAGGVHPFTLKPIDPVRSMVFDLENPPEAVEQVCRPMYERWVADADNLRLVRKEEGIDIRSRADRVGFEATIRQVRPQLVVIGPVYKMVGAVSSIEEATAMKEIMLLLDRLRKRYNVAFVLEHHSPHSDGTDAKSRPAGTSLWKRWPNMGLAMSPVESDDDSPPTSFRLTRFRQDRVKNDWPQVITRAGERSGGVQPWLPSGPVSAEEERPVSSWVPRGPVAAGGRF